MVTVVTQPWREWHCVLMNMAEGRGACRAREGTLVRESFHYIIFGVNTDD